MPPRQSPSAKPRPTPRGLSIAVALACLGVVVGVGYYLRAEYLVDRLLLDAKSAIASEDPTHAKELLRPYLAARPTSGEGWFYMGRTARILGDLPKARESLDRCAAEDWVPEMIALERALVHVQTGDGNAYEGSLLEFVQKEHPESRSIVEVLTPSFYANFRLSEAERLAITWTEFAPLSASAWKYLGLIRERMRKRLEAQDALEKSLAIKPDQPDVLESFVRLALETKKRVPDAMNALRPYCETHPEATRLQVAYANCFAAQGDFAQATQRLDGLLQREPTNPEVLFSRGKLAFDQADTPQAVNLLQDAVARSPYEPEYLYAYFQALNQTGATETAAKIETRWRSATADLAELSDITRQIATNSRDPELRRRAGELCLRNGRADDGLRWYQSALALDPLHAATHTNLADYYDANGNPSLAKLHREAAKQRKS